MNPVFYFWILGAHDVNESRTLFLDSRSTLRDMNPVFYFWILGAHDMNPVLYFWILGAHDVT